MNSRIACLAGTATILAATAMSSATAQLEAQAVARQVTASYAYDYVPAPDGARGVLIRVIEGKEQLFLRDGQGGERQITHGDADHEDPAISPDGKTLAYVRIADGQKAIMLSTIEGRSPQRLSPISQSPIHPAFSPDGRTILYCTDDDLRPPAKNAAEIYAIDLATRKVRTVVSGGVNTYPVMAPDGKRIAWRKIIEGSNSEVFVADADGGNARNITNDPAWEGWPAWSPDGRTIAFAGNRHAAWQIFLVDPDGTNLRLLAATEGRGTAPKWSADGKTIFFTVCRNSQVHRGCDIFEAKVKEHEG